MSIVTVQFKREGQPVDENFQLDLAQTVKAFKAAQGGGEMSGGGEDLPPSDLLDAFISGLADHSSPLR